MAVRAHPSHITLAPHCRRELQGNHRNLISQIVVLIPLFFLDSAKRAYFFCRKRVKVNSCENLLLNSQKQE